MYTFDAETFEGILKILCMHLDAHAVTFEESRVQPALVVLMDRRHDAIGRKSCNSDVGVRSNRVHPNRRSCM
jgi:hypothetical protein